MSTLTIKLRYNYRYRSPIWM